MLSRQLIRPSTQFVKLAHKSISSPIFRTRQYHSQDHKEHKFSTPKTEILDKALKYIPEFGFQEKAVLEASRSKGYSDAILSLFPHGTYDLIHHHLVKERKNLENYLQLEEFTKLGETDRVKYLVRKRLLANAPYAAHLSQLQSYLVLPSYFKESSEELHNLSDDIIHFSGDRSNDFAWYSKRLLLSSSYVAFELFMSNDKSEGFENTLALADRRLDSISGLGSMYNDVEEFVRYGVHSGINLIKSQASRG